MITISITHSRVDIGYSAGRRSAIGMLLIAALFVPAIANAATPDEIRCGPMSVPGQYGPFDYRTATQEQKFLVEGGHFTADVERLKKGTYQRLPGPDISYTLRAFPNHPRALKSMMELAVRDKTTRPYGAAWPVDCYFNRALRFAPDDPQVRMLYGVFLLRAGEKKGAAEHLEAARAMGESSGNFHYNLGLAYFQLQEYDKAREQAHKARDLGFDLDGLKRMLERVGQWREKEPDSGRPATSDSAVPNVSAPRN